MVTPTQCPESPEVCLRSRSVERTCKAHYDNPKNPSDNRAELSKLLNFKSILQCNLSQ